MHLILNFLDFVWYLVILTIINHRWRKLLTFFNKKKVFLLEYRLEYLQNHKTYFFGGTTDCASCDQGHNIRSLVQKDSRYVFYRFHPLIFSFFFSPCRDFSASTINIHSLQFKAYLPFCSSNWSFTFRSSIYLISFIFLLFLKNFKTIKAYTKSLCLTFFSLIQTYHFL